MALRTVTLGVLGDAEVAANLIVDTLNAHFSLGAEDREGYFAPSDRYELHAFIPAGEKATSQGIHAFWEWVVRCELPYQVLFDETMNDRTDDILGNVADPEEDILINSVNPDLGMVERLGKADNPMLLVLSTEGRIDDVTADAAAAALREGIPVHDLSRMLLEITWQHLPDHEPPVEAAVDVEADGQLALVLDDAPDVTLTAGEVVAVRSALEAAESFINVLFGDLVNQAAVLRQSLLHGRSLLAPRPEAPSESQGDGESKKTRLEIFNPESGQWEPAGRGRPPKSAQTRRVPA
ncbi:hypothetical protein [Streptomyces sp. Midd1]|uniref:hypothetical protein n=1 Tax=Streptomyces sp. Midd3 TaxID=3161191 RepID=UPI0034DB27B6